MGPYGHQWWTLKSYKWSDYTRKQRKILKIVLDNCKGSEYNILPKHWGMKKLFQMDAVCAHSETKTMCGWLRELFEAIYMEWTGFFCISMWQWMKHESSITLQVKSEVSWVESSGGKNSKVAKDHSTKKVPASVYWDVHCIILLTTWKKKSSIVNTTQS